jgi:26S proteasome regulatory subunit N1
MTVETTTKPNPPASKEGDTKKDDEMSEEDRNLKSELDMLIERLQEPDINLYEPSLQSMRTLIRTATTSMTSVPKPLKFMRNHYPTLRGPVYENIRRESLAGKVPVAVRQLCADIISVLAMALCNQKDNALDTLQFRLRGSPGQTIEEWGHEYVRHLTHQVTQLINEHDIDLSEYHGTELMDTDDSQQQILDIDLQAKLEDEAEIARRNKILGPRCYELVCMMVDYFMDHNAEAEAVDLCQETVGTRLLVSKCQPSNYQRATLYMLSCLSYLSNEIESQDILETCYLIYTRFGEAGNALRCALRMARDQSTSRIMRLLNEVPGVPQGPEHQQDRFAVRRQLCFILARHSRMIDIHSDDDQCGANDELRSYATDLDEILNNELLSDYFHLLCRDLGIMDAKVPEDVYKSHLEPNRPNLTSSNYDSARANQAASFVNGLLNCGFGGDKLMITPENEPENEMKWVYKNKEVGMMAAVSSLGWIMLWDVENGLAQIDKYLYAKENYIKAGALLACGVVNSTVHNDTDPAKALLSDYLTPPTGAAAVDPTSADKLNATAAIIAMGVVYTGSGRQDILDLLSPFLTQKETSRYDLACLSALSMGLVSVGNSHTFAAQEIVQCMMTCDPKELESPFTKFMALGLALTTLNDPESVPTLQMTVAALPEPARSLTNLLVDCCSKAGTGDVLKIQQFLQVLSKKYEVKSPEGAGNTDSVAKATEGQSDSTKTSKGTKSKKKGKSPKTKRTKATTSSFVDLDEDMEVGQSGSDANASEEEPMEKGVDDVQQILSDNTEYDYLPHQPMAVLGVALIAMGDDIGQDMTFRMFGHLLRFGELPIKRAVPLALALMYASNPQLKVLDLLSKFSHDPDHEISYNAILAMGIVGAGTNNARLAAMLRQLAIFHQRDSFNLFMVRLAQGLTHLGKGTLALTPWHSDRFLLNHSSIAALLALFTVFLDVRKTFLNKMDYLFFYITPAIRPRLLMTFDVDLRPLVVSVRVGQAVDTVGQAGRPKTITGFQTHSTPVLLACGERAELAT